MIRIARIRIVRDTIVYDEFDVGKEFLESRVGSILHLLLYVSQIHRLRNNFAIVRNAHLNASIFVDDNAKGIGVAKSREFHVP